MACSPVDTAAANFPGRHVVDAAHGVGVLHKDIAGQLAARRMAVAACLTDFGNSWLLQPERSRNWASPASA